MAANQVVGPTGKGDKDRLTMLPEIVKADLAEVQSRADHLFDG